jgi:hypothetical protein
MPWQNLTRDSIRILECARDGRSPWDYVRNIKVAIGLVDQLLELGLLEEHPPLYCLTDIGKRALEK